MGGGELVFTVDGDANFCDHRENQCGSSPKTRIDLPRDPAVQLPGRYTRLLPAIEDGLIHVLTALFTVARMGTQPSSPPADNWMSKMLCLCTRKFASDVMKNKILKSAGKWLSWKILH